MDLKNSEQKSHQNKTEGLPRPHFKRYYEATATNTSTRHADRPVSEQEPQKQTLVCTAKCLPTNNAAGEAEHQHAKKWLLPVIPHTRVNSKWTRPKRVEIIKPLSKQRKTASWHWI